MTHTSREYAEALFALAQEEGRTAEYAAGLETVKHALEQDAGFLNLLSSPAIPREARMEALSKAFEGAVPTSMLLLMRMMIFRGHARSLPAMIESYGELARENRGESVARVMSAVPLTAEEQEALREKLEKRFGRRMILECQVDPALLGGVRVETEGRVMDGTLRARLQEIKEVMDS